MLRAAICPFPRQRNVSIVLCFSTVSRSDEINSVKAVIGTQQWNQLLNRFESLFGFSVKQGTKILLSNPAVAKIPEASIQRQFDSLHALGYKTTEIKDIILEEPRVLLSDARVLKKNYINLLRQLGDCDGRIAAQFAPNTLVENEYRTNEKIDYCTMEMCLTKQIIAKSKVLKCDLPRIRTRHSFAFRSGYYTKINPKNKEALAENPKISELMFSSTQQFLSLCKGLTLEEYVIFESMIAQEENEFKNEEDSYAEESG